MVGHPEHNSCLVLLVTAKPYSNQPLHAIGVWQGSRGWCKHMPVHECVYVVIPAKDLRVKWDRNERRWTPKWNNDLLKIFWFAHKIFSGQSQKVDLRKRAGFLGTMLDCPYLFWSILWVFFLWEVENNQRWESETKSPHLQRPQRGARHPKFGKWVH